MTSDQEIRDWLLWVMRIKRLKPTPLAKKVGLSPSTVLRALDSDKPHSLERRSIDKIVQELGVPPPGRYVYEHDGLPDGVSGFAEGELEQLSDPISDSPRNAGLTPTQGRWRVRSRALELFGYLPGDEVVADSAIVARARDVVIAQILSASPLAAETVMRLYDPPYLLTGSFELSAERKPVLVDNTLVSIWGVVIKMQRTRQA